ERRVTKGRISDEEDDEFSSQFDKMMNDAIKSSQLATVPTGTSSVTSATAALNLSTAKIDKTDGISRPLILLRGKNNRTTLKGVDVKEERLERVWKENMMKKEMERAHLKKLTLAHSARQIREEEEAVDGSTPSTTRRL
ncbi:hypothetical protein PFISCL1PPCAC_28426, partial [Pristionchus fissidentatus]